MKIVKLTMDDWREVYETQKTYKMRETREKIGHARDKAKTVTHVSRFKYFLVHLNFIPYRMRKFLCLVHNYRFYHETIRDVRHKQSVS